ncbi:MAG TPA: tyrosine--tRNA ligase [Thermoanaerobaculia bacterium]|nr:tyrosine--tRNA ligase [Thermoanaerobaculia bacterium]
MSTSFPPVEEQLRLLRRGAVDLVDEDQLRDKLERSARTGKPLQVKTGFDPTSPHLHLGHTVLLRKMRHFQDLGHRVIFLIGDFTGMIGDPSGKKATRPQLSRDEVEENARTYQRQVYTVLDRERTVIEHNSRWLGALGAEGIIRLAGSYTLARMMERVDFRTRFEQHQPISLHELLYPLVQGYDSIALEADVELGGHDQIFNLLVGRDLMRERGMEPQVVLTVPLLRGTDGVDKMSKSLGNAIGLEEPPREIYGKSMSIPDDLMWDWLLLLTDVEESEITQRREATARGELHPKEVKQELARRLVAMVHGEDAGGTAQAEFEKVFAQRGRPENVEIREAPAEQPLQNLLLELQLASSRSDARRLIQQGAVSVDGERVSDPYHKLPPRNEPYALRVGKLRFLDVRTT